LAEDDEFEENDSPAQAITIVETGTFELMGLDQDWFMFDAGNGGTISISISGNEGDLDLGLFDALDFDDTVANSGHEGSNEAVEAVIGPGVYYFVVLPFEGQTGAYTMTVMTIMRIGGLLTVLALTILIYSLWRRERSRVAVATP